MAKSNKVKKFKNLYQDDFRAISPAKATRKSKNKSKNKQVERLRNFNPQDLSDWDEDQD